MEAWPKQLRGVREGQGMCSLAQYGGYHEIDWIAYDKVASPGEDNRFAVLMLPFATAPPDIDFTGLPSPPGTAALRLCRNGTTDILVFGNGRKLELVEERLVTDGALAWIQKNAEGQRHGTVIGGETLTWDGEAVPVWDR
jgi:hypothetical protein